MVRTVVRAGHVIAFQDGGHRHLQDGVVVIEDDRITHVGSGEFDGQADEFIDARDKIVTPGFINTHTHLSESPLDRSFVEDRGPRNFYLSGLFEFLTARDGAITDQARRASVAASMPELIRTGTTTVVEMGRHGQYVAEQAEKAGLRAYIGEFYRSGRWYTKDGKSVQYEWSPDDGAAAMQHAVNFIKEVDGRANGRIKGFLTPVQVDTCSEALLRRSREMATELKVPLALHVSQSVPEFQEMVRRNGCSPVEWLEKIGFLGNDVILGHVIMPGGSSWTNYHADDVGILADTGTNVAHAVWVFARRGIAMESYSKYLARQHDPGDGHLPAEHDRGAALDGRHQQDHGSANGGSDRRRRVQLRDIVGREGAWPRRSWPDRTWRQGRPAVLGRCEPVHDAGARSRA